MTLNAPAVQFIAPPAMVVRGDRALLKIVMDNLIGNSVKFSAGREQPMIRLCRRIENGAEVFSVQDNGAGFDERYAAKLFQPFHRLHSATEFPGTGLGLATVQKVVARHGGHVWARSDLGRGTTVSFTLWTRPDAPAPAEREAARRDQPQSGGHPASASCDRC